jgi:NAD(P)-dependent dehydrogenase (short-subunit alcohol dehydrogenase family)
MAPKPVCIVTGVGPGTGLAVSRRFAAGGFEVAMMARSAGALEGFAREVPGTHAVPADVTDDASIAAAVDRVRRELGAPSVLVHNAGNAVFGSLLDVDPVRFEAAWRVNAYGLFAMARAVVPDMLAAGAGTIVVTGATASLRGGAGFAAFASAKAAQRVLAESMARSFGKRGVHVAYVVIDGVIDMPATRAFFADKPDEFFLQPDAIAETYWHLAHQHPSAWTFQADVRPFGETW